VIEPSPNVGETGSRLGLGSGRGGDDEVLSPRQVDTGSQEIDALDAIGVIDIAMLSDH
jgi:hypothetical protein